MKYQFLSYKITPGSAVCVGAKSPSFIQTRDVKKGDFCNEWTITIPNHMGTHMDAPAHHYDSIKIADLPMDRYIYQKPFLIDIPKGDNELILKKDLLPYAEQISKCDLLMLRTGHSKYHDSEPELYARTSPGVSSEAAEYINKNFENVKGVIMDFISLTSYTHHEDGTKAHKWLLGEYSDHYATIIEDANLEGLDNRTIEKVFSIPIRYSIIDSCQVSVLAEIRED